MKNKKIITGITVAEQMHRAKKILKNQVIPQEKEYQKINNNMKKFELSANFIGSLFVEVEANTPEEAKEKFLTSLGTELNGFGEPSVSLENITLPSVKPLILTELNMAFPEGIEIEEVEN